ncbi:MAG: hypothetical protein WB998_10195 [Solirubrobacteraceae bacterium]
MSAEADKPPAMPPKTEVRPPEFTGFWKTTASNLGLIVNWDIACAAILTGVAVWRITTQTLEKALATLLAAEFGIIGALLGIVIAGLAIIVAFLSADYATVIMRSKDGPSGDFWPFWYVAAIAATSVIASGCGLLAAEQDRHLRHVVFGITTFFALYSVLATVNLVGFVKTQGETRAYQLALEAQQQQQGSGSSDAS